MRIAVISDIHANLHALEAVLAEVDAAEVDELWCLGDLVGYGPRPNECVEVVRARADVCLAGNHDLAVLGEADLALFVGEAEAAARWTREVLEDGNASYLASLKPAATRDRVSLAHGSPTDPVWEYILTQEAAVEAFAATDEPLILVGHSHVALEICLDETQLRAGLASGGQEIELDEGRFILNPGSVGQPRDGDPRAGWLVIDGDAGRATFRRTDYPIAATQAEMRERDLPDGLSERLEHGT
jgi:predicted phosphodiesterase